MISSPQENKKSPPPAITGGDTVLGSPNAGLTCRRLLRRPRHGGPQHVTQRYTLYALTLSSHSPSPAPAVDRLLYSHWSASPTGNFVNASILSSEHVDRTYRGTRVCILHVHPCCSFRDEMIVTNDASCLTSRPGPTRRRLPQRSASTHVSNTMKLIKRRYQFLHDHVM